VAEKASSEMHTNDQDQTYEHDRVLFYNIQTLQQFQFSDVN